MDRYLVISSDCHAGLPPEQYRDYLDPQYRETFDQVLPIQLRMTQEAAEKFLVAEINEQWRKGHDAELSGAWDHDERIKVLDNDGIAAEVIYPDGITEMNMPPFGAGLSLPTDDIVPDLQWAGARAHNRWLAELCQMAPERRAGVAIVPLLWDVEMAVEEVRWAKQNGLKAVLIPNLWGKFPSYQDPKYDPFWRICEEQSIVVTFHSGAAPMSDFGEGQAMIGIYITEVAWWTARPLTHMIWGGVFARFPELQVQVTEGTSIWVPEFLELMDFRYEDTPYSAKLGDYTSHLEMKPSEYFARNISIGASCMPRKEALLRNEIGLANLCWGSDYPHPEGSWPHTLDQMKASLHGLPESDIAAILGKNEARIFGFDEEKLAPLVAKIGPKKSVFKD